MAAQDGKTVYLAAQATSRAHSRQVLAMWDVNGDGKITKAEMKERGGPAGAFPQLDLNGDGVIDRDEHTRA